MASPVPPSDRRAGAFAQLRGATRWTLFGATVATATFAGLAAHDLPGRRGTSSTPPSSTSTATAPSIASPPSGVSGTSGGSRTSGAQPVGAPIATTQPPVAVSGGSAP
ncbi:MAG: hypothetical protein M0004_17410 [Actinomycetota bacterium]|nr:hypothetical protein [Actinomycetota bacterium]